jgi:hypothetical protein
MKIETRTNLFFTAVTLIGEVEAGQMLPADTCVASVRVKSLSLVTVLGFSFPATKTADTLLPD